MKISRRGDDHERQAARRALILVLSGSQATAQRWPRQLPQDQREQPTIDNLIQSLETYDRERPVNLGLDKLWPTFRFAGEREETERFPAPGVWSFAPARASASRRLVGCDAEDQAVPGFDRGAGRKCMRAFRAALTRGSLGDTLWLMK